MTEQDEIAINGFVIEGGVSWDTGYVHLGLAPFDWRLRAREEEGECFYQLGPILVEIVFTPMGWGF